jgi:hypothetical protein
MFRRAIAGRRAARLARTTAFVVGSCGARAGAARAATDAPELVHVLYDAPGACPDVESFVKEVRARTSRFQLTDEPVEVRSFRIAIAAANARFVGEMRVVDREGKVAVRSVEGTSCDEVATTLAFVVALSIDPSALASRPPGVEGDERASPRPIVRPPPPPESNAVLPSPPIASVPAPAREGATANTSTQWRATAGVAASLDALAAPGVVVGEAAFLGVTLDRHAVLSPVLRLGGARAESGAVDAGSGQASFTWTLARLELCPIRWPAEGPLAVRPCVRGDAGTLAASTSSSVHDAQSPVRPWRALGGLAALEWAPFKPLVVEAQASLSLPLVREIFYIAPFAPSRSVYQAPSWVPGGTLVLAVRFP